MGIHSVPIHMAYLYSRISQVRRFDLGERRWKPVVKKFCARPQWFLEIHTHSYRSICRRIYRIKFAFFKFPWNLFPTWAEAAKYTKRNCNNRRMLCEVGEPLFVIRRLTLRPLIEDISDKSQTLEGVTLEQKTPYLICIWTLQGSLVDLSIYISGKHVQHLEVFLFFNLVHCSIHVTVTLQPFLNTPFPSSKPLPLPFCPSFLAVDPINEEESKIPSDNTNVQPMASC